MNVLLQCTLGVVLIFGIMSTVVGSGDHKCTKVYKYWETVRYTTYYSQKYTVKCGWSRCGRYRHVSSTAYRSRLKISIRSVCCSGWRKDRHGKCSIAICHPACHATQATCIRPNVCACRTGFTGRTCHHDVDECHSKHPPCDQMCINTIGSYRCECNSGYRLDTNRRSCTDIDECAMSRTQDCEQLCVNVPGSYQCACYDGYTLQDNGRDCGDNDPCEMMSDDCEQFCINREGGYACNCSMGYALVDGNRCPDIDECAVGPPAHDCTQVCINAVGNFNCSCNDGYQLGMDGRTCYDIDECAPTNCDIIQICEVVGIGQTTRCTQVTGYVIDIYGCEENCLEIDYSCNELQVCQESLRGGVTCACVEREGHPLSNVTQGSPKRGDSPFGSTLTRCQHQEGSFSCLSFRNGEYLLEIDNTFCLGELMHDCTETEVCENTEGGFECSCKDGYIRNDVTQDCDDIDECSTDAMNCPDEHVQICQTVSDTIRCQCVEGVIVQCQKLEGILNPDNCDLECRDVQVCLGDACTCYEGYFLNIDNRPCMGGGCGEILHDCKELENCQNTIGGYDCTCAEGYARSEASNGTCEDVDECLQRTNNNCTQQCMNLLGTYVCDCAVGYALKDDGYTCYMQLALSEAYTALAQEDGLDKPAGMTVSLNGYIEWWLIPIGILIGVVIAVGVALGRKKSKLFRKGTDMPLNAFRALSGRKRTSNIDEAGGQAGNNTVDPMEGEGTYESSMVPQM